MPTPSNPHALDLTRNRNTDVPLGPFDSKVGTVLKIDGENYYVVTNANYIPAMPIKKDHHVFLRSDMRYGEDDPTQWLRTTANRPLSDKWEISIMWWDPTPDDFIHPETGLTAMRSLGRLKSSRIASLTNPIDKFLDHCMLLDQSLRDLLAPHVQQIRLGLERLQTLPSTFNQTAAGVTSLQQAFLEAEAILRYMTEFKLRMRSGNGSDGPPPEHCMGVFTTQPVIAQEFRAAGLPYWYMRPTFAFLSDNILEVVEPQQPVDHLKLEPTPGSKPFPTQPDVDSKIHAIHSFARLASWYKDPFRSAEAPPPASEAPPPASSNPGRVSARFEPYAHVSNPRSRSTANHRSTASGTASKSNRDKFTHLDREEMPSPIPAWESLVVASEDPTRRQIQLHHLSLMMDALNYRLGDPRDSHQPLTSQEWRDVLQGHAASPQAGGHGLGRGGGRGGGRGRGEHGPTMASQRAMALRQLLGPALEACGIQHSTDFPTVAGSFAWVTIHRAKEILWVVAETNFRFELLALDCRASGEYRPDKCRQCFAGGMLVGTPVELSKQGLASMSPASRHVFIVRIAELMCHWNPRPASIIAQAPGKTSWKQQEMHALEVAVATHYMQTFYELFGRAAVVPMRLVHEFGT
ncbi:hypothetical protein B0H19DRAFT_1244341 [Mycena capillaripes]|nr:hypothetical protein B0H19DRAFT_1244341 [Mycena capillaripes]